MTDIAREVLLDELACVYAHAAVDALFAEARNENPAESGQDQQRGMSRQGGQVNPSIPSHAT